MPLVFLEKFNELETLIKNHKNLPKKPKKNIFSVKFMGQLSSKLLLCFKKRRKIQK